jgi:hypothetical protein
MHQKYLDEGETLYIGRVEGVGIQRGNERVRFMWLINSDPRVNRTVFKWAQNNKDTMVVIPITRDSSGFLIKETILNIKEGIYTFKILNMDDENHESLAVETTVQIFGPKYISNLTNRNLSSSFAAGKLTIKWVSVESEYIQYVTVRYTDRTNPANPVARSLVVENSDTQTVIEGVEEDDVFSISTAYLPEGGLDILDAVPVEYTIR